MVMRSHIVGKHLNFEIKPECKICFKTFANSVRLKIHMWSHDRKPIYECSACSVNVKTYESLKCHVENSHPDPEQKSKIKVTCDICRIEFYSKYRLEQHMSLAHFGAFKCLFERCTMKFTNFYNRRKHYLFQHNQNRKVSNIYLLAFMNF